jgi:hypothetical protein
MPGIREHPGNNNPFNIALMVFLKFLQKLLIPPAVISVIPYAGEAGVIPAITR